MRPAIAAQVNEAQHQFALGYFIIAIEAAAVLGLTQQPRLEREQILMTFEAEARWQRALGNPPQKLKPRWRQAKKDRRQLCPAH